MKKLLIFGIVTVTLAIIAIFAFNVVYGNCIPCIYLWVACGVAGFQAMTGAMFEKWSAATVFFMALAIFMGIVLMICSTYALIEEYLVEYKLRT